MRVAGAVGLVLAVATAYAGAMSASFQFDDFAVIVDNPDVHGLSAWWQSMPGIRPLLKLSYALNWSLSNHAGGFHLFNVAVHAINALLVWALARHWLRTLAPKRAGNDMAAWSMALLFALHPAATEAVTYVSGRSVSLMALPYLAAMLLHAETEARKLGGAWRLTSPLAFALALGVRETAVTLPLALLLFAWFRGDTLGRALPALKWHGLVLAVVAVAAAVLPGYQRFFSYSLGTRGVGEQVLGQMVAHAHLFKHSLIGLRTNIDPDLHVPSAWGIDTTLTLVCLAGALGLAFASRRRWPWLGFGIAWYLLHLAPSNSLMPRFDLANDRHLYLALPGAALILVIALMRARSPALSTGLLLGIALLLGRASHERTSDYRNEVALWQATVRSSPDKPRAWANLGWARQLAGDMAGARAAYECALSRDPEHQQSLINISVLPPSTASVVAAIPNCVHR